MEKGYSKYFYCISLSYTFCFMCMIPAFISENSEESKAHRQELNVANKQVEELGDQVVELIGTGDLDSAKTTIASFSIPKYTKVAIASQVSLMICI